MAFLRPHRQALFSPCSQNSNSSRQFNHMKQCLPLLCWPPEGWDGKPKDVTGRDAILIQQPWPPGSQAITPADITAAGNEAYPFPVAPRMTCFMGGCGAVWCLLCHQQNETLINTMEIYNGHSTQNYACADKSQLRGGTIKIMIWNTYFNEDTMWCSFIWKSSVYLKLHIYQIKKIQCLRMSLGWLFPLVWLTMGKPEYQFCMGNYSSVWDAVYGRYGCYHY